MSKTTTGPTTKHYSEMTEAEQYEALDAEMAEWSEEQLARYYPEA